MEENEQRFWKFASLKAVSPLAITILTVYLTIIIEKQ
jgi:hypothetical protein